MPFNFVQKLEILILAASCTSTHTFLDCGWWFMQRPRSKLCFFRTPTSTGSLPLTAFKLLHVDIIYTSRSANTWSASQLRSHRFRVWHTGLVHAYAFQSANGTLFCQEMMRNERFLFVLLLNQVFAEDIAWLEGAFDGLKKDRWSEPRHEVCGPRCLSQP